MTRKQHTRKKHTWKQYAVVTAAAVLLLAPVAFAGDRYDDFEDTHPLRIVAYPVHAVGSLLEWLVARPLHALVSQPKLAPIFGHDSHPLDFDAHHREAPAPTEHHQPG